MKRHWTHEDLVEHFTLLPAERDLIATARGDHTRLALAVLLKSFQLDGRFPITPHEVPASVAAFLAQQLALDPLVFGRYDWWGRVIDDHRRLIRVTLGVQAWTNADTPALITQLTEELLRTHSRDIGRLCARPFQTGGNTTLNRSTWFRYYPRVVLVPLRSLLGTAPWLAACLLRGAVCPLPTPLLSTNSASGSTESAR
jgi:hypothetical protein